MLSASYGCVTDRNSWADGKAKARGYEVSPRPSNFRNHFSPREDEGADDVEESANGDDTNDNDE